MTARGVLAIAALLLLGACNAVVTKTPLFTNADEAGAPPMKPGVWLVFTEENCRFEEKAPIDEWPDCAGGVVIRPGQVTYHESKAAKGVFEHDPFVLAAGDPRIAQVVMKTSVSVSADASASGGASANATASGGGESQSYTYGALVPTKLDAQGRIIAAAFWPILCGPPPPQNDKGEEVAGGTLKPLPGMEMKPGDPVCTTSSTAALRGAAKASKAWADRITEARWLRDGDR